MTISMTRRIALAAGASLLACHRAEAQVRLPHDAQGSAVLRDVLAKRKSVRNFDRRRTVPLESLGALLHAAQGIREQQHRMAPSAGALYPLTLYVQAERVEKLARGLYRYTPEDQQLTLVRAGITAQQLANASLGQEAVQHAALSVVFAATWERTTQRYGERGKSYVWLEAGHASQNVLLMAPLLGLGAVPIGAFSQAEVDQLSGLDGTRTQALYINCVGVPAT